MQFLNNCNMTNNRLLYNPTKMKYGLNLRKIVKFVYNIYILILKSLQNVPHEYYEIGCT